MNQEIIGAKAIIAELRLTNDTAHRLTHMMGNLLTVQKLVLEQIHRIHPTLQAQSFVSRIFNNGLSTINATEKEPPEPPPDEDEPKPPIEEPPTEEPPVKEPATKESLKRFASGHLGNSIYGKGGDSVLMQQRAGNLHRKKNTKYF